MVAKLRAASSKKYASHSCSLSVLAYALSNTVLLDEEKSDYFFPYPLASKKRRDVKNSQTFDFKKLFLVSIKFHESDEHETQDESKRNNDFIRHKHLFFLFVHHMFARPTDSVRTALKSLCKNVDAVCQANLINSSTSVRNMQAYKFVELYNHLLDNKEVSNLSMLSKKHEIDEQCYAHVEVDKRALATPRSEERKIQKNKVKFDFSMLKSLNQDCSGQLNILPIGVETKANQSLPTGRKKSLDEATLSGLDHFSNVCVKN